MSSFSFGVETVALDLPPLVGAKGTLRRDDGRAADSLI